MATQPDPMQPNQPPDGSIRVLTALDRDDKPVVHIIVNGMIFTTSANSTEHAIEIARETIHTLMDFRECATVSVTSKEITEESAKSGN